MNVFCEGIWKIWHK